MEEWTCMIKWHQCPQHAYKTIIFSDRSLPFRRRYCNFSKRYMMTSPLHFYLSLNAFSPTFWISCQPPWSASQCFFGAQMTELGSTFKDNCLIGVFSYAVGSWGPEKGSDNSVIMRLEQIYAFVGRAAKNELTASCSLCVHSPSMDFEIQLKLQGLFQ